jgi:hypothetical protein
MKNIVFGILLMIYSGMPFADELKIGNDDVDSVVKEISSVEVSDGIFTPIAYIYVKKEGIRVCALIDVVNKNHVFEIDTAEGRFGWPMPNDIKEPVISKLGSGVYATYIYINEDPRLQFNTFYQPVKLTKDGFYQCKEEDKITHAIERNLKAKVPLQKAVDRAIQKVGCTVSQ